MPPRIFTFDAKAASSQDVEKVVDHNGRDQIRINDKATKLTLAISPSAETFSGHFALSSKNLYFQRCAGGDGKGQCCRFVINLNLITTVMIDHFFDICDDAALASNVKIRGGTSGR